MKRILLPLLLILSIYAEAQQDTVAVYQGPYTPMTARGYQFKSLKIDSSLFVKGNAAYYDSVFFHGPVFGLPYGSQDGFINTPTVSWVSGLTFDIGPGSWRVNGIVYNKTTTNQVTLAASDPTNPREDYLVANTSSSVVAITGTPSNPAAPPDYNPLTQLPLALIRIAAGATTPTGISNTLVYNENIEWTVSSDMTGFNAASLAAPFAGTKSTLVTANTGTKYIKYLNSSVVSSSDYTDLKFYIRLTSAFSASAPLTITFYNGNTPVSSVINVNNSLYLNRNTTGTYQTVTIPLSALTFTSNSFDNIQFRTTQSHGGFHLDLINLQTGITLISNAGVTSFNGRTGSVFPLTGDYIVESATVAALPVTGQTGKVYVITSGVDINKAYRWTGSAYALIGDGSGSGVTPAALTKTDDTNVTLSLSGTPSTSLLQGVNIAAGWTGTLADGRIASASTWNAKISKAYAPLIISGDTISQRFNAARYGAVVNDGIDDTQPIRDMLDAVVAAGGGDLIFPVGEYNINGPIITSYMGYDPNCQIPIPTNSATDRLRVQIRMIGESLPNGSTYGHTTTNHGYTTGVIFKSNYAGTRSTTNPGTAIIGANGPAIGGYSGETLNYLTVENITFVAKNNPNGAGPEIGGVNGRHIASLRAINSNYYVDTPDVDLVEPTRLISGFETSDCNNEAANYILNCKSYGVRQGFYVGEHTAGDQVDAEVCLYGVMFKDGNHGTSFNRVLVQRSKYALGYLASDAGCNTNRASVNISLLSVERDTITTKWFKSVYAINDSLNKIYGNVRFVVCDVNVGTKNTSWYVNGATNCISDSVGHDYGAGGGGGSNWTVVGSDIKRNSKVGVNMTPVADLDVTGLIRSSNSQGVNDGQLQLADNSGTPNFFTIGAKYITGWPTINTNGATSLSLATNDVARMTVHSGGNILLGTTTNDGVNKLQVAGTVKVTGTGDAISITGSSNQNVQLVAQNTDASGQTNTRVLNSSGDIGQMGIYGSTRTAYGAIAARSAYLYGSGTGPLNIFQDGQQDIIFSNGNGGGGAAPISAIISGTTGALSIGSSAADASAKLDIQSTTQGVLMPRLTATAASAISSPADGLMVYVTSTNGTFTAVGFWGRENGVWIKL